MRRLKRCSHTKAVRLLRSREPPASLRPRRWRKQRRQRWCSRRWCSRRESLPFSPPLSPTLSPLLSCRRRRPWRLAQRRERESLGKMRAERLRIALPPPPHPPRTMRPGAPLGHHAPPLPCRWMWWMWWMWWMRWMRRERQQRMRSPHSPHLREPHQRGSSSCCC